MAKRREQPSRRPQCESRIERRILLQKERVRKDRRFVVSLPGQYPVKRRTLWGDAVVVSVVCTLASQWAGAGAVPLYCPPTASDRLLDQVPTLRVFSAFALLPAPVVAEVELALDAAAFGWNPLYLGST